MDRGEQLLRVFVFCGDRFFPALGLRLFGLLLLLRRSRRISFLAVSLGDDQQPAIRTLAETFSRDPGIVLQRGVDNATVGFSQGLAGYRVAVPVSLLTT